MLRATVRRFLLLMLAASIVPHSLGAQRRPRPSTGIPNGLDTLGLWQPESVRAILLLYSGKSVSKPKAEELEATLKKDEEKIDERLTLIGYYTSEVGATAEQHYQIIPGRYEPCYPLES